MGDGSKIGYINKVFEDAYKTDMACIILDDIERLMDYIPIGPRFSSMIVQGLKTLISKPPPKKGRHVFIFATTSSKEFLEDVGVLDCFDYSVNVPDLKTS